MASSAQYSGELQKGGSCWPTCCGVTGSIVAVVLWGVFPWFVGTGLAYDIFIKLNPLVWEYTNQKPPLTPRTIPDYIWWPGCTKNGKSPDYLRECAPPCYSPELIPHITEINKGLPFKMVSYKSRKDDQGNQYNLKGWWLPGETKNLPSNVKENPRIVLNHGFTSNSNKWWPTLVAGYLRSMGFSVLINNLVDHGYSQNSSTMEYTWGYRYHYDYLGAWDYAVNDPDGKLGGKMPAAKVGVMGGSAGAFVTLNAFSMEPETPAIWADSPPDSPKDVFFYGASHMPGFNYILMIPGISPLVWYWMSNKAGVDLEAATPLKNLPKAEDKKARPVQIVINDLDKVVPVTGVESIQSLLKENTGRFDTEALYRTSKVCNTETHLVAPLVQPKEYREKLCNFWTSALDVPKSMCALDSLPSFDVEKLREGRRLSSEEERLREGPVSV